MRPPSRRWPTIKQGGSTGTISFTLADEDNTPDQITVTATSSNQLILPNEKLVLGGTWWTRTLSITPDATANGTALITIRATDSTGKFSEQSFTLTIQQTSPWYRRRKGDILLNG